jgi:oligopeptide transport system substrate-binding protein
LFKEIDEIAELQFHPVIPSRPHFLRALPIVAVATLGLLGCGRDPSRNPNVLKLANMAEPASLDPALAAGVPEIRILASLFEGLTRLSGDSAAPANARAWETSPDQLRWTFHLRPARWSDGKALTARDYVWSWNRATLPQTAAPYADLLDVVGGARSRRKTGTDTLAVRARDDSTMEVDLDHPVAFLPLLMAQPITWPVPRHVIDSFGSHWTDPKHFVGNGPWRLAWWHPYRSILAVRRSDRNEPRIDSLLFLPVEDAQTAWQMSRAGQVDWLFQIPLSRLKTAPSRLGFVSAPQYATYFYRFNATRKPFNDPRVRRALSLAIPRRELVRFVTAAGEEPAQGLLPPLGGRILPPLETDIPAARRLLAQAGFPAGKGFPAFEILYNSQDLHRRLAEVVARTWQDSLGITARPLNYEWKSYLEAVKRLDYSVARGAWVGDYLDPSTFLDIFTTTSGNNRTGWNDALYDSLLARAGRSAPILRMARLDSAHARLLQECPIAPVYHYRNLEWRNPRLAGIAENALGLYDWTLVHWRTP